MRAHVLFAAVTLLGLGCGSPRGGVGTFPFDAGDPCTPNAQSSCLCVDGRSGTSVCSATGVAGACVCSVDGQDGGASNDLVLPSFDVVLPDAGVRIDAGGGGGMDAGTVGAGAVGAPCTRLTDCSAGVCLPTGRCSRACAGPTDWPGSWNCSSLPGLGPVCACTPRGEETCNNLDDDCDGLVDEGTTRCNGSCVDVRSDARNCGACRISCGGGTSCVNGACACPSNTPLACAGRCVDGRSDPSNCGSCGNVCANGSTCTNGVCQRAGMCPSSCSVSAQCAPCATPGETGSYCCVSGLCIYMSASTCTSTTVDSGLPDVDLSDTGSGGGGTDARLD